MWVPYQRLNRAGLRKAQESVRPNYENSALVRAYQPKIVPGLLQTAAYTTALLEDARDRQGVQRDDVAEAVAERTAGSRVLTRAGHRFVFVIEEQVLRYRFCDRRSCASSCCTCARQPPSHGVAGDHPAGSDRRKVLPREGFIMFDEDLVSVELISGVLSVTPAPRDRACTSATSPTWPASPSTARPPAT